MEVTGISTACARGHCIPESLDPQHMQAAANTHDPALLHPLFSDPDGDVILGSKGRDVLFRTHSFILKTTSGWFKSMFSLPQKYTPATPDVIYMDEDAPILETLLRMTCGLPITAPNNYDDVDALLFAAEKYDMPGPMSIIRMLVMTPPLLNQPLRLYAVACRFGWKSEAQHASTETLSLDLNSDSHRASLQRLSASALLDLFELHHDRREALRKRLDDPPFVSGGFASCVACGWQIDYHTWRELKYKIILEMDVRPLGDTVVNVGLLGWHEAKACWNAQCLNVDCDRALYDKAETLRVIRECIQGLRKCI